jgi:hypothetical protein
MTPFSASQIWTAFIELSAYFFSAWLAMHNRILTGDNVIRKHWECNQTCSLCYCLPETADHLLAKCNFIKDVWNNIASQFLLPSYASMSASWSYLEWVRILLAIGSQKRKENQVGYAIHVLVANHEGEKHHSFS